MDTAFAMNAMKREGMLPKIEPIKHVLFTTVLLQRQHSRSGMMGLKTDPANGVLNLEG